MLSSYSALPLGSLQNFEKGKGRLSTKFFQRLSEARTMRVMQLLRHDVAYLDCIPLVGAFAFLFCLAAGASLSSRFRLTVKGKCAFTVSPPALVEANGHLSLFYVVQLQRLAPRIASEFRERQRTPFHEILPASVGADIGAFAFLLVYHFFLVFGCLTWCEEGPFWYYMFNLHEDNCSIVTW